MISTSGDIGLCGKGEAAENSYAARAYLFGRDENIGATVTEYSVLRYWILDRRITVLVVP
ncbi:MAG: hypothetical protein IKW66_04425 [Clostridia bacterium]|nr:hypothetical protein [Clostridia bacterium]